MLRLVSIASPPGCGFRRQLRLLRNVAGNVGSEPIAVTLLQQQNGVHRSAKKAVAHQWQESLIGRAVADASVEGMAPCLVERGNRARCFPLRELARRMPAYFTVARVHASLGNVMVYARIIHKNSDLVNVKPTIIIGKFSVRPASISYDNDSLIARTTVIGGLMLALSGCSTRPIDIISPPAGQCDAS